MVGGSFSTSSMHTKIYTQYIARIAPTSCRHHLTRGTHNASASASACVFIRYARKHFKRQYNKVPINITSIRRMLALTRASSYDWAVVGVVTSNACLIAVDRPGRWRACSRSGTGDKWWGAVAFDINTVRVDLGSTLKNGLCSNVAAHRNRIASRIGDASYLSARCERVHSLSPSLSGSWASNCIRQ